MLLFDIDNFKSINEKANSDLAAGKVVGKSTRVDGVWP
jgi:GGDEF domain-containing protein